MDITPTAYINAIQSNGDLKVKEIINYPGGVKRIITVDRKGREWEKAFFRDGAENYIKNHKEFQTS